MKSKVTNFVVTWLETFAVIAFLLMPVLGLMAGGGSGGVFGAIIGALIATVLGVLLFGVLFLLIQNNQVLKDIRAALKNK